MYDLEYRLEYKIRKVNMYSHREINRLWYWGIKKGFGFSVGGLWDEVNEIKGFGEMIDLTRYGVAVYSYRIDHPGIVLVRSLHGPFGVGVL